MMCMNTNTEGVRATSSARRASDETASVANSRDELVVCENCKEKFAEWYLRWDDHGHPEWNEILCEDCKISRIIYLYESGHVIPDTEKVYPVLGVELFERTERAIRGLDVKLALYYLRLIFEFMKNSGLITYG